VRSTDFTLFEFLLATISSPNYFLYGRALKLFEPLRHENGLLRKSQDPFALLWLT